jgi:hypothetical protein
MSGENKTDNTASPWVDKEGIAARYDYCIRHVTNLMRRRKIPYCKDGKVVRFNINDCDRALRKFEVGSVGDYRSFSE